MWWPKLNKTLTSNHNKTPVTSCNLADKGKGLKKFMSNYFTNFLLFFINLLSGKVKTGETAQ